MGQSVVSGGFAVRFPEYDLVLSAAGALAGGLERTSGNVDYETRQLVGAVEKLDEVGLKRFGFKAGPESARLSGPLTPEQTLLAAAADAQVASVLLAASKAVGEQGAPAGPEPLRNAIRGAQANLTSLAVDSTASDSTAPSAMAAAKTEAGLESSAWHTPELSAAFTEFKSHAENTLTRILNDSDALVTAVLESLGKEKDRLLELFGQVGSLFENPLAVPPLLRRGWDTLLSAIRKIYDVATRVPFDRITSQLTRILEAANPRTGLEYAYGAQAIRNETAALTLPASSTPDGVKKAAAELVDLSEQFSTLTRRAKMITGALGIVGALVAFKLTGPLAVLAVPAAHVTVVVAVIVIGMDYTDSGALLDTVKGIRGIMRGMAA